MIWNVDCGLKMQYVTSRSLADCTNGGVHMDVSSFGWTCHAFPGSTFMAFKAMTASLCVCACVCACVRACVCVRVCVDTILTQEAINL